MNVKKDFLNNWYVVILRTMAQSQNLSEKIKIYGGVPLILPTIDIHPLTFTQEEIINYQQQFKQTDYLFVASVNAVNCLPKTLKKSLCEFKNIKIITMGQSTSQALLDQGNSIFFTAPSGSISESLLQISFFQEKEIRGKRVTLLVGEGGRTVLADTLSERGAKIHWIKTYCQRKPTVNFQQRVTAWQKTDTTALVAMSVHALENLLTELSLTQQSWLMHCPLIVISHRIAEQAKKFGFRHIGVASGTDPDATIMALQQQVESYKTIT